MRICRARKAQKQSFVQAKTFKQRKKNIDLKRASGWSIFVKWQKDRLREYSKA